MTLTKFKKPTVPGVFNTSIFPTRFNDLFDGFENLMNTREFANFVPAANVSEENDKFIIELSTPGFNKGDFKVAIDDNVLTISSEKKEEHEEKGKEFTRKEFSHGSFSRSFNLPENVNADSISANYEDGILNLTLPKKEEEVKKVKEIPIS